MSFENTPAPMAAAVRLLDEYQHAAAATYNPDVPKAVAALEELIARAQETIRRLKGE